MNKIFGVVLIFLFTYVNGGQWDSISSCEDNKCCLTLAKLNNGLTDEMCVTFEEDGSNAQLLYNDKPIFNSGMENGLDFCAPGGRGVKFCTKLESLQVDASKPMATICGASYMEKEGKPTNSTPTMCIEFGENSLEMPEVLENIIIESTQDAE